MLAKRWLERSDRDAEHRLVTSHLRLVAKIAMGYRGYGLPTAEVIAEGNLGLMKAVTQLTGKGLPSRHLCHVVDPGINPGIRAALVVAGENGHHRQSKEIVFTL